MSSKKASYAPPPVPAWVENSLSVWRASLLLLAFAYLRVVVRAVSWRAAARAFPGGLVAGWLLSAVAAFCRRLARERGESVVYMNVLASARVP